MTALIAILAAVGLIVGWTVVELSYNAGWVKGFEAGIRRDDSKGEV